MIRIESENIILELCDDEWLLENKCANGSTNRLLNSNVDWNLELVIN
jgi:hypothetical protein